MKHQRARHWHLALTVVAAIGLLACGDGIRRGDGGGDSDTAILGSGGQGGQGGSTVAPGTGGAVTPANGGAVGPGGASGLGGATTGAGGAIPPAKCATDAECAPSGLFCETTAGKCVACTKTADCPAGGHCSANVCVTLPPACENSLDCTTDKVCDPARGLCVACAKAADCAAGQDCVANACVASTTCQTSLDCGTKVCDATSKKCVDCASDNDCNVSGGTTVSHCIKNACKPECLSDKQCTPQGMLCDTTTKVCAQCKANADCPASSFCDGGQCKADVCDSTMAMCSGTGVAQCNAAGSGFGAAANCPADKPCKALGGAAACGGPPVPVDGGLTIDGGQSTIDGGGIDGPLSSCNTATVNPCNRIPAFTGTQTVDGKDDEFCDLPSFVLNKAAASAGGIVNNYNGLQDAEFPSATVKVAWSAAGLHAFFDVTDAKVQSVTMADPAQALTSPYQGDSIELFVSSNDTATGAPGGDSGAVHVTLAATGKSALVQTTNTNGLATTYSELPAAEYAQAKTATGYAVEALIPWKGGAPGAGTKIRFDLALNIADNNFGQVSDMRDAQIIYSVTAVTGQTSCPGAAEPYCDDRTWCEPTLQ